MSTAHIYPAVAPLDRTLVKLTMLSYALITNANLMVRMKIPSFKTKINNKVKKTDDKQFVCKECKMTFQSKDSLELHKRKSRHFTGLIYFANEKREK